MENFSCIYQNEADYCGFICGQCEYYGDCNACYYRDECNSNDAACNDYNNEG